jgi:predicted RNA-binding protein with RPS1 domain
VCAIPSVTEARRLEEGRNVTGVVVCHHPFGLGVRLEDREEYGHVDVPQIRDGVVRGVEDYPPVGERVRGRVLGHAGDQLRLTLRGG